jgi:hypothetical protein
VVVDSADPYVLRARRTVDDAQVVAIEQEAGKSARFPVREIARDLRAVVEALRFHVEHGRVEALVERGELSVAPDESVLDAVVCVPADDFATIVHRRGLERAVRR